jgi:adenosine deaminase
VDPLETFLRRVPKMELHCHLLGTVRRDTFAQLARRAEVKAMSAGAQAPVSEADVEAFYTRAEKPVGVLRVFLILDRCLLTCPDEFHRL